jgi:hypothetical protein
MIKAGTAWLFDQLKHHPDFWMPPVKEIRYLHDNVPDMLIVQKRLQLYDNAVKTGIARRRDGRDYRFLREAAALIGHPVNVQAYSSLFRHKRFLLSGDISPIYSRLSDAKVANIAKVLPNTKILLLVRDPLERAWSGLSMLQRHGKLDVSLLDDAESFREYYRRANKSERFLFPSKIVRRWQQHAPQVAFRYFFFDDIVADPEKTRREILLYLGADPEKKSGSLPASHNRKAEAKKLLMTDEIKTVLVEHFADELRASAELLGGPAKMWLERYGLSGTGSLK